MTAKTTSLKPPLSLSFAESSSVLKPRLLGVAGEHAEDVAGPDRRLVAADARPDLDDHVLLVGRVPLDERELQLLLELAPDALGLGDELRQLGVVRASLDVVVRRAPLLRELVRRLQLLQPPSDLRRLVAVAVDRRVGHALLQLGVRALEVVDQLFDRRSHASMLAVCAGRVRGLSPDTSRTDRRESSIFSNSFSTGSFARKLTL